MMVKPYQQTRRLFRVDAAVAGLAVLLITTTSTACVRAFSTTASSSSSSSSIRAYHSALFTPQHRRDLYRRYEKFNDDSDNIDHSVAADPPQHANGAVKVTLTKTTTTSIPQQQTSTSDNSNINNNDSLTLQAQLVQLQAENARLQQQVRELQQDNKKKQQQQPRLVVLENFEGEFSGRANWTDTAASNELDEYDGWCDVDDFDDETGLPLLSAGECPVEPRISFGEALRDRAVWLIGLLMFQSASGLILSHNEALLERHPVIIYFLTMLVGAGGNAGNQASVRVIRGLALGTLNESTQSQFLQREFKMAAALSGLLAVAGFIRAAVFATPFAETVAVTAALWMIVLTSVCLGAVLPLGLRRIGVDPAHSSTSIQVIMDILGVVLAVVVSSAVLDSPLGVLLIRKLGG